MPNSFECVNGTLVRGNQLNVNESAAWLMDGHARVGATVVTRLSVMFPRMELPPGGDDPIRVPESWLYRDPPSRTVVIEARERRAGYHWRELYRGRLARKAFEMCKGAAGELELVGDGLLLRRVILKRGVQHEWRIRWV